MTHFACKYIGLPWVAGAQGPDKFDCWGMVRWILKHEYGIDAFRAFNEVEKQQDGDVVLLRQSKHPVHAGLWLDADGGGVLHCCRDAGVIFQDLPSMRLCGWQIDSYYRVKGK